MIFDKDFIKHRKVKYYIIPITLLMIGGLFPLALIIVIPLLIFYTKITGNTGFSNERELINELKILREQEETLEILYKEKHLISEIRKIYNTPAITKNEARERRYERERWKNESLIIETSIENFLQKNADNTSVQLEKRFYDIYENIILNHNYSQKYEPLEKIKRIYFWKFILKSLFLWWIIAIWIVILIIAKNAALVKITDILQILSFTIYIGWFFGIFIFLCKFVKKSHYGWLTENSHLIINTIQDYFQFLKNKEAHHRDALLFSDLITFLWENIQARTKEMQRLERKILNNYQYFWKKIPIPEEITNFFTKEKIDIQEISILWQKIIWEWIEIEKNRLQQTNTHMDDSSIIISNTRRELLLKSLEKMKQK